MNVAALVLAAGASSRLRQPKQLLTFRGKSLVRRAAEAALAAGCAPVLVVHGAAPGVVSELRPLSAVPLYHEHWEAGLGSSIRFGIERLEELWPTVNGVALLTCDQPLVDGRVLARLLHLFARGATSIAACRYGGSVGIPAIFSRKWFPELRQLPNRGGAKKIILDHPKEVTTFEFHDAAYDVDTPADLERLRGVE